MSSVVSTANGGVALHRPAATKLKDLARRAIAEAHLQRRKRDLPNALAIYFHELEPAQLSRMDALLAHFRDQGYQTVDAHEYATAGEDRKVLFISFDDCFRRWHRALDLFARHEAQCTFYVNSLPMRDVADKPTIAQYFERIAYKGDDRTLSSKEVRELHAAGHTIGCHSHSHRVLSALPRSQWDSEIRDCKERLEQLVDAPVLDFSFPYGKRRHFNSGLRDYCRSAGFRTVVSGLSGMQYLRRDDPFSLHRTGWNFELTLEENIERLRVHAPFYGGVLGRCAVG